MTTGAFHCQAFLEAVLPLQLVFVLGGVLLFVSPSMSLVLSVSYCLCIGAQFLASVSLPVSPSVSPFVCISIDESVSLPCDTSPLGVVLWLSLPVEQCPLPLPHSLQELTGVIISHSLRHNRPVLGVDLLGAPAGKPTVRHHSPPCVETLKLEGKEVSRGCCWQGGPPSFPSCKGLCEVAFFLHTT